MKTIYAAAFFPFLFCSIFWGVHFLRVEVIDIYAYGVIPRTERGLYGIFLSPFFHGSWEHLISNTIPFLALGTALFMFYKDLALKVLFWIYIGGGVWLWCFGREAIHIGASGVVYGIFSFLSISGIIRGYKPLIAISLLTIFLYGSMIWGVFPLDVKISWEGHLSGLAWGVILSVFYRNKGPQEVVIPISEDNTLNELKYGKDYWKTNDQITTTKNINEEIGDNVEYNYIYVPKQIEENGVQKKADDKNQRPF